MKIQICIAMLLLSALTGIAAAETESPAAQISVTDVTIDPGIFMRGDEGKVTVEITNTGQTGVAISRAKLYTGDLTVVNDQTYDSVGTIGPGNSMTFTFTVRADVPDGIYYPKFYLDFRDGGCLRYYVPVEVENTGVAISVIDIPDSFSQGNKEDIILSIGNPRDTIVKGVIVTVEGEGVESTQSSVFVGNLDAGASAEVTFEVTPSTPTDLEVIAAYRTGINPHTASITIPVEFGTSKIRADPVVNNMELTSSGTGYTLTGDVTNAGLEDAYSIMVTVDEPAQGIDPYPVDVIGALDPDDFSSFEVTFTAQGASAIPLVVQYKDEDGNTYEETVTVALNSFRQATSEDGQTTIPAFSAQDRGARGPFGSFGGGLKNIPVLEIVLLVLAGVVGIVAWRKGVVEKIRERFRDRSRK